MKARWNWFLREMRGSVTSSAMLTQRNAVWGFGLSRHVANLLALSFAMSAAIGVSFTAQAAATNGMQWIAHRGASWNAPEETVESYQQALATSSVDYLELDLQRSKDGVLFLIHDDTASRTTNFLALHPEYNETTQPPVGQLDWSELSSLDAGSWYNQAFADRAQARYVDQRILSLDDFLNVVKNSSKPSMGIYFEFKNPAAYPGIEAQAIDQLKSRQALEQVVFQSFDFSSLVRARALAPANPYAWLFSTFADVPGGDWKSAIQQAKASGIEILAPRGDLYGAAWYQIPLAVLKWRSAVKQAHDAGLKVHVWVLDSKIQVQLFHWIGVDAIFTDRIDQVSSWVR